MPGAEKDNHKLKQNELSLNLTEHDREQVNARLAKGRLYHGEDAADADADDMLDSLNPSDAASPSCSSKASVPGLSASASAYF